MVFRSAQAGGHSAVVDLRSGLVNSLFAYGSGRLAGMAAANSPGCVAGIGPVHGAIDPQWTLVFRLFRSAKARGCPGRNHRSIDRHRPDGHAIRGTLTAGILADDTLRRLGPICFLPELRNLAPE